MTVYLTPEQVVRLHDRALGRYGGSPGLRDSGALASALAQPAMEAFGVELYPSLVEKAAAYLFFLARNHALVDGNKRTAFLCTNTFLLVNGTKVTASNDELFSLALETARGEFPDAWAVAERLLPFIQPE